MYEKLRLVSGVYFSLSLSLRLLYNGELRAPVYAELIARE
jgi:hypothetical protein